MEVKISSKQKGSDFEKKFSEYMKEELGYDECYLNERVTGLISTNNYEVDIIGKKLNETGEKLKTFGYALIAIGGILVSFGILGVIELYDSEFLVFGGIAILGGVIMEVGKNNMYEYTWVECKDHKSKISKDVFNNLNMKVKDYHDSKDKRYEFNNIMCVSGNGYTHTGLDFAKEYKIECYQRDNATFKNVKSSQIN